MTNSSKKTSHLRKVPKLPAAGIAILLLAPLILASTQALWPRWIAIMALAWWLPGALLVAHWRLRDLDLPTATILAIGLGLCWMVLGALLLLWIPGPTAPWLLAAVYEFGALLLLVALYWRRPIALQPVSASIWGWVVALLLFACLLRLPGLGYHELHGDEAVVLHRARWAILGADDVLARHAKGPGEIAVAAVAYRALGTDNETTARLPFALMGVGSVLATALLGRRLFSRTVGLWAGLLLTANGFAIGLSRIVQYQPAVLILSVLTVLCAWEFAQRGEARWLALVAVFSGFGILMHYEFALLAPALLLLVWMGYKHAPDRWRVLRVALAAGLIVAVIVAATYLPSILNPRFARTQRYLGSRLGGFGAFNVPLFVEMGTFYSGTYFFAGLILLVVAGLVLGWRTARRRTLLLGLWFTPFLVLHLFVMSYPGTHFYLFMPSWSLLAALPLAAITQTKTMRPLLRWGALSLAAIWLAVSAGYLYLAFFQQAPEYVVNYEQTRSPFYWAPYGQDVPKRPRYGFPVQAGWKALGTLAGWGCLDGTYASNEGSQSLQFWYLPPLRRAEFDEAPDLIFVTTHLQTEHRQYESSHLNGYQQVGDVRVRDEPRIEIWAREPLPVPYVTYDSEDYAPHFDRTVPTLEDWPDPAAQVGGLALGDALMLESARLERTRLKPGDTLHMLLVWRPQQALAANYKVFVHIADENDRPITQWDGLPCQNLVPTSQWTVGEAVKDHVLVPIPKEMPPGEYQVLVGLYDGDSGERLGGQALRLGEITIR